MVTGTAQAETDRGKLHMRVVAAVEARILSGELQVGDRLPSEAELARSFSISTRSVREGMQVLETKGLVRRRHGERAEVVRDDVRQFMSSLGSTVGTLFARDGSYLAQLMDVRRMCEVEAAGRIAAGEGNGLAGVKAAIGAMRAAVADEDVGRYTDADAAFHRAIVDALGNEVLAMVYGNLNALVTDVIRVAVRVPRKTLDAGLAEHEEILACLEAGDAEASRTVLRKHIENSTDYLRRAVDAAAGEGDMNR